MIGEISEISEELEGLIQQFLQYCLEVGVFDVCVCLYTHRQLITLPTGTGHTTDTTEGHEDNNDSADDGEGDAVLIFPQLMDK